MPKPVKIPAATDVPEADGQATATAEKKPRARKPAAAPKNGDRPVLYPEPEVKIKEVIDAARMKALLKWETEEEYAARLKAADPRVKEAACRFKYPLLTDENGQKVFCWNNSRNRPLDLPWAKQLAQTILLGQWQWNGESLVVSTYGTILSGQHRGVGLMLADQMWRNDVPGGKWRQHFKDGPPSIVTNVSLGVPEDGKTLMTIDNVKARSEADVFFTSKLFEKDPPDVRKVKCRMLAAAVDLVWARSGAGKDGSTKKYKTHQEACGFLDRHRKLVDCVQHIYEENDDRGEEKFGRAIDALRISPGQAAGMCYLMAAGNTDGDAYRGADSPSERKMDLGLFEKAAEYWVLLAGGAREVAAVREELSDLLDDEDGRPVEKLAIIALGWAAFKECGRVTPEDVDLAPLIGTNDLGNRILTQHPTFGGIDLGVKPEADPPVTEEAVEDEKTRIRREAAEEAAAKLKAARLASGELDPDDEEAQDGSDGGQDDEPTVKAPPRPRPVPRKV